jgi:hypothetical protein
MRGAGNHSNPSKTTLWLRKHGVVWWAPQYLLASMVHLGAHPAAHHARPGLDLALPVAERGEGRNDDVRPAHAQELALEGERRDGLRRLAQALRSGEGSA